MAQHWHSPLALSTLSVELSRLPDLLGWHLLLTLLALAIGITTCIPAGIWASRSNTRAAPLLAFCSIIQTIPSLALLALMVALTGTIGFLPALVALTLYSTLPILRNTITGLTTIDPELRQSAIGLGLSRFQRLRHIELPLARPLILGGIRTSLIWVVGSATLATPVGQPSLGNYIFRGLQTQNNTALLTGVISAASLALLLDAILRQLELGLTLRQRTRTLAASIATVLVLAAAIILPARTLLPQFLATESSLKIGTKSFTEQYILGNALRHHLQQNSQPASLLTGMGSSVLFDALKSNSIDLSIDYTGTIWTNYLQHAEPPPTDRAELLSLLTTELKEKHNITLLAPLGFENTYALAVTRATAQRLHLKTVADLLPHASRMAIAGDYEFFGRPEWTALKSTYNLTFARQLSMDAALMYPAARDGSADVIVAFSTDGRIPAYNLTILTDDRHALPPYDAVLLLSPKQASNAPLRTILLPLANTISTETMQNANRAVDLDKELPRNVGPTLLPTEAETQTKPKLLP